MELSQFRLAPKKEQPKRGYMHPRHLLGYGPQLLQNKEDYVEGKGWAYCIAPSSSLYDSKFVND